MIVGVVVGVEERRIGTVVAGIVDVHTKLMVVAIVGDGREAGLKNCGKIPISAAIRVAAALMIAIIYPGFNWRYVFFTLLSASDFFSVTDFPSEFCFNSSSSNACIFLLIAGANKEMSMYGISLYTLNAFEISPEFSY